MKQNNSTTPAGGAYVPMEALLQVLETPPAVSIAPDFASRVMRRLPARRRRPALALARSLKPRYGTATALVAAVALAAALVLVPWHAASPAVQAGTELLLSLELVCIVLGLFVLRWRYQ